MISKDKKMSEDAKVTKDSSASEEARDKANSKFDRDKGKIIFFKVFTVYDFI